MKAMKQEKWVVLAKKADFEEIGKTFGVDPVVARLIRNRDVEGEEAIRKYLYGSLRDLYEPALMADMKKAAEILLDKIGQGVKIRVIGDYDVDGIMASYILTEGIRMLGNEADTVIPHRMQDGYGLNEELILHAYEDGVDTIVTCDNGIAAFAQIEYANSLGMTVIVTDHHEIPYEETKEGRRYLLPRAAAVVDPKREDCGYPFPGICGAVVALKLMQYLFEINGLGKEKALDAFLEMAAFATISDVMELADENRILVKYGLKALQNTKNVGLRALIEACEISEKALSVYHVGFILGPCINATGRLDTAKRAMELLQCKGREEAYAIAMDLRHMNESRKDMTQRGVEDALKQLEACREEGTLPDKEKKVLIIYLPDCHESLAGIIAGRIRDRYGKPVFVLTDGEDGIKGSGRSIEAYSMYEELSRCKDLFTKYGGHKMAAGLSLPKENLQTFIERMEAQCSLQPEDFVEKISIDMAMPLSYVNHELIAQFSMLEPFGCGNKKPLFAQKNVSLLRSRILGKTGRVGKYLIEDEYGQQFELTYFGEQDLLLEHWKKKGKIHVTYYPEINSYRGKSEIQFVMQNYM